MAVGLLVMIVKCYRKVEQGQALVRNGYGGTKVTFSGIFVIPIIHKAEYMDISLKRIEIDRNGKEGLICQDNLRADIKVAFFVRVNKTPQDVLRVAQSVGCKLASNEKAIVALFDAKFSEALKTVGKQFDFEGLYNSREQFKEEILKIIGTDLNGFVLDDAAIDYLEQTSLDLLNENNILDSQGIRKIIELTAKQKIMSNKSVNEKEKTIKQQDVEAKEAILELERQQAEKEERQKREIAAITAREEAETAKVQEEERLKSERARIATEEEVMVAEENKNRQIVVAQKNKERTEAIETERVEKDRLVEVNERERVVAIAEIEKEKNIETEKKNMQTVIRERVVVERAVVEEQEKIKDVEAFANEEREKKVAITKAEARAEEEFVKQIKEAEASKKAAELQVEEKTHVELKSAEVSRDSAELNSQKLLIEAEAKKKAAEMDSDALTAMANAETAQAAATGMAEVKVMDAKADAIEKQGAAEARVMELKFSSEAKGIEEKANAMKLLDGVGREHEEFKLKLNMDKEIEIANIETQKEIADNQATILAEALKNTRFDIVGGEPAVFEKIISAITYGKVVDRFAKNSELITDIKDNLLGMDLSSFQEQLKGLISNIPSDLLHKLNVEEGLNKLLESTTDDSKRKDLYKIMAVADGLGILKKKLKQFIN